jgi:hypothetical protein
VAEYRRHPKSIGYRRSPLQSFRATGSGVDPSADLAPCPEPVLVLATEDTDTFTADRVAYQETTAVYFNIVGDALGIRDGGPAPEAFTSAGAIIPLGSTIV